MADNVVITSVQAEAGSIPFEPDDSGLDFDLVPVENQSQNRGGSVNNPVDPSEYIKRIDNLSAQGVGNASVPNIKLPEIVVVFDTETTGTSLFKDKLTVCTLLQAGRPKSEMQTFAGWDEEILIREIADYLNAVAPTVLVAYNIAFDRTFLLSRCMLYQVQCPCLKDAKNYDMMDILGKGGEAFTKSISGVGKAEEWLFYLFGETKPYMIDEIMDDMAKGDLTTAIIRNRVCVGSEADLYVLAQYVFGEGVSYTEGSAPTLPNLPEAEALGFIRVQCPNCLTANEYNLREGEQNCFLCGSLLDPKMKYDPEVTLARTDLESKYVAGMLPNWRKNQNLSGSSPLK